MIGSGFVSQRIRVPETKAHGLDQREKVADRPIGLEGFLT